MLKPEVAQEQLKQFKSPAFVSERIARLAGVPENLREDARAVFDLDCTEEEQSPARWIAQRARQQKAVERFRAIDPADLGQLLRTVVPELAPYVLRAIATLNRFPYTSGFGRKPFRSLSNPKLLQGSRIRFLSSLFSSIGDYPPDVEWIAAWAPHAWPRDPGFVGQLLAAAIDENDAKGRRVFDILLESARGEHEIGQMGRHVVQALLMSQRVEGWEFMERMLLAAQREEGLRQSILELIDQAHPDVFRRFVRLVLEHDLVRFSATVRAVDVWFGFLWDAMSTGKARQILETTLRFLDDPSTADAAIGRAKDLPVNVSKTKGKKLAEAEEAVEPAYLALWSKAFEDIAAALAPATQLAQSSNADVRFVATHLLGQLQLVGGVSRALAARLDDPDERVAARALSHFGRRNYYDKSRPDQTVPDLFERIERLISRAPAKTMKLAPIVWPWMQLPWGKQTVGAALLASLDDRPATRLLPHMDCFDVGARQAVVKKLGESAADDPAVRQTLLSLVGDPSRAVRMAACQQLKTCVVSEGEAGKLEALLARKAADLRRTVLAMLLNQPDAAVLASADRLIQSRDGLQRVAGLELLREMAVAGRATQSCHQRGSEFRKRQVKLSAEEITQLDALAEPPAASVSLEDCLGLIDPSTRTRPLEPRPKPVEFVTPATIQLLKSLDELVHSHRERPFVRINVRGETKEEVLLGTARWQFPRIDQDQPLEAQLNKLPFQEIWMDWLAQRSASERDADGLELLRATWLVEGHGHRHFHTETADWLKPIEQRLLGSSPLALRYLAVVLPLLGWLSVAQSADGQASFILDGLESVLCMLPREKLTETRKEPYARVETLIWRSWGACCMRWALWAQRAVPLKSADDRTRLYRLMRWIDEPGVAVPRDRPQFQVLLNALEVGGANEADVYDHFLGPRAQDQHHFAGRGQLGWYSGLGRREELDKFPALRPIVERCKSRVLEIELTRGETPTVVSAVALTLSHTGGMNVLLPFLLAAENETFARGRSYGNDSKPVVFSHIIRSTYPVEGDTPERFAGEVKPAKVQQCRLLELAVYAPQWSAHVEQALGWNALADAVWWIHAHTRDRSWSVDAELREKWRAEVARRTPLSADDLLDGAVDVAWFCRTYDAIGKARWNELYDVAKFAASGGGHKRAQLFADAMLGKLKSSDLIERIESKRNQDAVRSLGLIPLPKAEKARKQLLSRYKVLQEFIRTSRQFGSMRQASEKRAAAIGMENLARTAGYTDPIRLQWAMEAQACADLAQGPVSVTAGDVTVRLSLDIDGRPELTCTKKGKPLAAIPPAVKKIAAVSELSDRKTDLKRSAARMRQSLELAMVRGDVFTSENLAELCANPLLAPSLGRLVFIGEGITGYPVDGGRGLADFASRIEPIKKGESLRIAHPHDLLAGGRWSDWQKDCFCAERVQPFKQIFRELYALTTTEADAKDVSRRYAGHQVQPRQAFALFGSRGWITSPELGVFRTFHELGLTAWLTFQQSFFTPADIEGLTFEGVKFTKRSDPRDWMQLKDVPPRIFSEVMRDIDLAVSVAHRGGVDPEASASTVDMRTSLLSETLQLLSIQNVRIENRHALIKGELAEYTLHLGSGVTHRLPGGALFIVPVHSQHRGRLFLPFADDDPKTAEVISKVLLLARDARIKDPQLLAQIRSL